MGLDPLQLLAQAQEFILPPLMFLPQAGKTLADLLLLLAFPEVKVGSTLGFLFNVVEQVAAVGQRPAIYDHPNFQVLAG